MGLCLDAVITLYANPTNAPLIENKIRTPAIPKFRYPLPKVLGGQEKWRRKAYDDWRLEFGKGEFDPVRYENFKVNYMNAKAGGSEGYSA